MDKNEFEDDFLPTQTENLPEKPHDEKVMEEVAEASEIEEIADVVYEDENGNIIGEEKNSEPDEPEDTQSRAGLDYNEFAEQSQDDYPDDEEEEEKPKKNRKPLFIALAIVILLVCVFAFSDLPFAKQYRENLKTNIYMIDGKLGISQSFGTLVGENGELLKITEKKAQGTTYDNESYMVPFENAGNSAYVAYDDGMIVCKSNYMALYSTKGEKEWETATAVVNPIIASEGDYIAIAETGGTKINMFDGNELVYSTDTQGKILNMSISSNGDMVLVTKKDYYKGSIEVYNKKGEQVYAWNSGEHSIVCADISASSRKIAVGFIDTTDEVGGSVEFFDINKENSYKKVSVPNTIIYRVKFVGEKLNVFGDNRLVGLNTSGNVSFDYQYPDNSVYTSAIDNDGMKAVAYVKSNKPVISVYSNGGSEKKVLQLDNIPNYVDISGNRILYNSNRMIMFGKYGKEKRYPAAMDIKQLKIIDNGTFLVVYSNSIEFIKS